MTPTTPPTPTYPLRLSRGKHAPGSDEVCLLEAADRHAGGPGDDHSQRVSAVLGAFGRPINDAIDDEARQRLIPLIPMLARTGGASRDLERARAYLLVDRVVRRVLPLWLDARGRAGDAQRLRALPPIVDAQSDLAARAARAALAAVTDELVAAIADACVIGGEVGR